MSERLKKVLPEIPSPCFVLDEQLLVRNISIAKHIQEQAGVKILLALKGFSMYEEFPLMKPFIGGITASSLNEALLGFHENKEKVHSCFPVYTDAQFEQVQEISSHLTFNSISQFEKFQSRLTPSKLKYAFRVNPEYSEVKTDLYNPCSPTSRLGIAHSELEEQLPEEITGLHFHALCENDSHTLERTLNAFSDKYESYLQQVSWVNFGGGHLFSSENYDVDHLIKVLKDFKTKHDVNIIMEPGSAHAWQTGYLVSSVQDILYKGGRNIAMLDVSFTAHMPDCLEMPYKPNVIGEKEWGEHSYTFGGNSCLAGDQVSGFVFDKKLVMDQKIVFKDMMHYTMVKTSTFNGVDLPSIGVINQKGEFKLKKTFGYEDYRRRL